MQIKKLHYYKSTITLNHKKNKTMSSSDQETKKCCTPRYLVLCILLFGVFVMIPLVLLLCCYQIIDSTVDKQSLSLSIISLFFFALLIAALFLNCIYNDKKCNEEDAHLPDNETTVITVESIDSRIDEKVELKTKEEIQNLVNSEAKTIFEQSFEQSFDESLNKSIQKLREEIQQEDKQKRYRLVEKNIEKYGDKFDKDNINALQQLIESILGSEH